jgi:hypothetical protein
LCFVWILNFPLSTARAQSGTVSLPTNVVQAAFYPEIDDPLELTNSFAPVGLTNVPVGYCVGNEYYRGWCVQEHVPPDVIENFPVRLYDSLGTNLPVYLQAEPWSQINYVLNHKLGEPLDAQYAIWYVQDGTALGSIAFGPIRDMVAAARQFGPGYVPPAGQIRGIILDPTNAVQRLIIETTCSVGNALGAPGLSITRSNSAAIISWPSPATGFTLQQNTNGIRTVNWSNVTATPSDVGSFKTITVNPPTGKRYYRLFKP